LERGQFLELRPHIHWHEFAVAFNLKGFPNGQIQIGHILPGIEHAGQNMIDFLFFHGIILGSNR
jgi:hypothetical protein